MSTERPVSSARLFSLAPAVSMFCSDQMSSYLAKKSQGPHPGEYSELSKQVFDCSNQVDRLVDESDCATLRLAYQMCFVNGKPLVCHECVQARTKYEQCLAMHVLPLVANKE